MDGCGGDVAGKDEKVANGVQALLRVVAEKMRHCILWHYTGSGDFEVAPPNLAIVGYARLPFLGRGSFPISFTALSKSASSALGCESTKAR